MENREMKNGNHENKLTVLKYEQVIFSFGIGGLPIAHCQLFIVHCLLPIDL
jgi:hypothetical protein